MPHAIVLFFDRDQSAPIVQIIEDLAVQHVSTFMHEKSIPHITLAIYDEIKGESSKKKLSEFASTFEPLSFVFSHIGLFRSKMNGIFAAPIVTKSLLKHHQDFHDFFIEEGIRSWENYQPDQWVPHCTLAFNIGEDKIDQGLSVSKNLMLPLEVKAASIGIMEFEPVKETFRVPFS